MNEQGTTRQVLHPSFRPFRDYLISMVPIIALTTYLYGWRVLLIFAVGSFVAAACDLLYALLARSRIDFSDLSSITFAWLLCMMLPAGITMWAVVFGVFVTVMVGKHIFGGYGEYPFHPSAFGFGFTAVSFPEEIFAFTKPATWLDLRWTLSENLFRSPAGSLHAGGIPTVDMTDLVFGDYAGPIGETLCLVTMASMLLMIMHHAINWQMPLTYLAVSIALTWLFPRVDVARDLSVLLELFCTGIPFFATYMVAEPTLSPKRIPARVIYASLAALLSWLITRYGIFENGACFALLLVGPLGHWLDSLFVPKKVQEEEATNGEE